MEINLPKGIGYGASSTKTPTLKGKKKKSIWEKTQSKY